MGGEKAGQCKLKCGACILAKLEAKMDDEGTQTAAGVLLECPRAAPASGGVGSGVNGGIGGGDRGGEHGGGTSNVAHDRFKSGKCKVRRLRLSDLAKAL